VHSYEIDYEGKDTWRMAQAGSEVVVISSAKKIAMIRDLERGGAEKELELDELARWLFPQVDIIITEGYKTKDKPKIEVTKTGELLCGKDSNLFAVVFNQTSGKADEAQIRELGVPVFTIEQSGKIVDLIEAKFLGEKINQPRKNSRGNGV